MPVVPAAARTSKAAPSAIGVSGVAAEPASCASAAALLSGGQGRHVLPSLVKEGPLAALTTCSWPAPSSASQSACAWLEAAARGTTVGGSGRCVTEPPLRSSGRSEAAVSESPLPSVGPASAPSSSGACCLLRPSNLSSQDWGLPCGSTSLLAAAAGGRAAAAAAVA